MGRPDIKLANQSGSDSAVGYGEIYTTNNAVAMNSVTTTYEQVTIFDANGESDAATTPDHTSDDITIDIAGTYMVHFDVSFSGSGSSEWELQVEKNNGATTLSNVHAHRKLGTGGDVGAASSEGIHTFAKNDTVELWVRTVSGTNNITITDGSLVVSMLDRA